MFLTVSESLDSIKKKNLWSVSVFNIFLFMFGVANAGSSQMKLQENAI